MEVFVQVWDAVNECTGSEPDGFSIHSSKEDVKKFVDEHWAKMPKNAPSSYPAPAFLPIYKVDMNEKTFEDLKKSSACRNKFGFRCYGKAPHPS